MGANLVRRLRDDGYELHVPTHAESNLWYLESIRDSLHIYPVNMLDREQRKEGVAVIKPDWVFHGSYPS